MSVSAVGGQSAVAIAQLVKMRAQFDDLQRQISTGQKSSTYAGLGLNRGVTVGLNAQLSQIAGYDSTIATVGTRINLMNTALGQMTTITSQVKAAMVQANTTGSNGSGPSLAQRLSRRQVAGNDGRTAQKLLRDRARRFHSSGIDRQQPAWTRLRQPGTGAGRTV